MVLADDVFNLAVLFAADGYRVLEEERVKARLSAQERHVAEQRRKFLHTCLPLGEALTLAVVPAVTTAQIMQAS